MFKKTIIITGILILLLTGFLKAQDSQTLYYMNRIPQSTIMNPALQPAYNFYLGLPVISSIQLGVGNNRLALTDVIMKHPTNDSLMTFLHPDANINTSDFLDNFKENNFVYEDFRTDLLSFGFGVNSWYFSFNLSEKFSAAINYPKDLMALMLQGNQQFTNKSADFSYLGVNSSFYREYGVGVSKKINPDLSVGVRAKVLFGHANISSRMKNNDLTVYSSRDSIYLSANATVNTSSPLIAETDSDGDFSGFDTPDYFDSSESDSLIDLALAHKNMGLGIDLGVYYKLMDKLSLSLSILDLGYIKWAQEDVTTIELKGNYAFKGIDISSEVGNNDTDTEPFEDMVDSLQNSFTLSNNSDSYTTYLGAKVYLGASYAVSKKFDVGFLSRTYSYNSKLNQAFTLSANVRPVRGISASLSYSMMNGSYNNIGFGLVLGGAPFQIYVISDNASAALWGHKTTSANVRFGLNIAFGSKERSKKNDKPLLESFF